VEERKELVRVALGREEASLVIKNGNLVNVYSGELLEGLSVGIKGDKIAFVGTDATHMIGEATEVIDASGKIVAPGFVDGHFHLHMPLDEFLEHAIPRGATTIFMELDLGYHLGYEAALAELANMKGQPMKFFGLTTFYMSPPPFLEQKGFSLSLEDYARLLERDDVAALGESVWTGIVDEDNRLLTNIDSALASGKQAEGHGSGAKGNKLIAMVASGISSCHEPINLSEAIARLRLGLYVMIREGSIRRDLEAISGVKMESIDFRRLCLVTDGLNGEDLLSLGHMDFIVQKAINLGIDPIKAFQMATINTAEHFGMGNVIGGIAPGRYADIVILPSLTRIECEYVISNGKVVARHGKTMLHSRKCEYPESVLNSIHIPVPVQPGQFTVPAKGKKTKVTVRALKLITEVITQEHQASLPVANGSVLCDLGHDILKVSIIESRNNTGKTVTGFIHGLGLRSGAIACSYSWELGSPLVVAGTSDEDMATAINRVIELQGGLVVADNGIILAELPLRIGAHVPLGSITDTARKSRKVNQAVKGLGCPVSNPFLTLQTIPGPSLPFFRITLQGFIDIKNQKVVDLIVE
jgi:adenine deaminase